MKMSESVAVSLFSGIGGFEVGFDRVGVKTIMMCERDPSAQAVLRSRFPGTDLVDDVVNMSPLPDCAILVGGRPRPVLSAAGRMAGMGRGQSGLLYTVFLLIRW